MVQAESLSHSVNGTAGRGHFVQKLLIIGTLQAFPVLKHPRPNNRSSSKLFVLHTTRVQVSFPKWLCTGIFLQHAFSSQI